MDKLLRLHPVLRRKVKAIVKDLAGHGFAAKVYSTWRSQADQAVLYREGRTQVWFSFHNATRPDGSPCALAADIADAKLAWGATPAFWKTLGKAAKAHGLTWGGDWKSFPDSAHVQLLPNSDLARVQAGWLPPDDYAP